MAAVLSVFIPGLGHIYKGKIGVGILLLVITIVGYTFFIVPGLLIHIGTISTPTTASRRTRSGRRPRRTPPKNRD